MSTQVKDAHESALFVDRPIQYEDSGEILFKTPQPPKRVIAVAVSKDGQLFKVISGERLTELQKAAHAQANDELVKMFADLKAVRIGELALAPMDGETLDEIEDEQIGEIFSRQPFLF